MNTDDMLDKMLLRYDEACIVIRKVLSDKNFLNQSAPEFKNAVNDLNATVDFTFKLKNTVAEYINTCNRFDL